MFDCTLSSMFRQHWTKHQLAGNQKKTKGIDELQIDSNPLEHISNRFPNSLVQPCQRTVGLLKAYVQYQQQRNRGNLASGVGQLPTHIHGVQRCWSDPSHSCVCVQRCSRLSVTFNVNLAWASSTGRPPRGLCCTVELLFGHRLEIYTLRLEGVLFVKLPSSIHSHSSRTSPSSHRLSFPQLLTTTASTATN